MKIHLEILKMVYLNWFHVSTGHGVYNIGIYNIVSHNVQFPLVFKISQKCVEILLYMS